MSRNDIPSIRTCVADHSKCAIQKLVSVVYDALPLASHTLPILQQLCHAPEFRHELLLLKPGLLNALLTKANSSQQDFDDYADLCVLILSHPLPIPLPSSAQEFFLRVFQRSNQNPCVDTLKPVYHMLDGACHQLFSLLPSDAQQQFDQQLRHILKSTDVGKDAMLLLWCFGIVLLIEYPEASHLRQTCPPNHIVSTQGTKKNWTTASGQKLFFGSMSLYRTISLASLSVVWAIKGGVGVSDEDAIHGIRIASRVLRVIDQNVRENWPKSDARAKGTFLKLIEKIERLDANSAIFFEAAGFHALIIGTTGVQSDAVTQCEPSLARIISSMDHKCDLQESVSECLPAFADRLQPITIQKIYTRVLETCMLNPSIHGSGFLITVMDTLTTAMCTSEELRRNALRALTIKETQDMLCKFLNFLETRLDYPKKPCKTYAASQHQKLLSATIATLLMTAATAHVGEPSLSPTLVMALIEKQRKLPSYADSCSHSVPPLDRSAISLFQEASTPYTGQHLQDWRSRLNSELESQNHYQRDLIIRSVAQICQDLESRCSTVEEPLRRERDKTAELEEKVAELSKQVSVLQSRISDDELHLQGLDDEKELLEKEKREMSDANKRLILRIDNLKNEIAEADEKAKETLRNMEQLYAAREVEREEEYRAWTVRLKELNGMMDHMKVTQEEKESALRTLNGQYAQLQNRLNDSEQQLQNERITTSRQAGELTHLQTRNFDMETQLRGTEEELELTVSKLSELQVSHQELKESSEEVLKKLKMEYSNNMEAAVACAEAEKTSLHSQLRAAQQETLQLQGAYDDMYREGQLLQASISSLEVRTQELTELCSEQEEELYELRTLRRNVLASMGLGTQNPLAMRSPSRSEGKGVDPQTPRGSRELRHHPLVPPTQGTVPKAAPCAQDIRDADMDAITDQTFASSGASSFQNRDRNPVRPKPYPPFKVPTMHTPSVPKANTASKSTSRGLSPSKRSVLRQVSPNRRHTTVGFTPAEKAIGQGNRGRSLRDRRGSLEAFEQADVDMEEDFMAGTPLTPGNFLAGTGRVPDDDETATEL